MDTAASVIPDVTERPKVTSLSVLRPLGPTHAVCVVCKENRARWCIVHARYGQESICSLCFLQDSGWFDSAESKQAIYRVTAAIGLKRNKVLERVEGRFVRCEDADDVLGAVVLHARWIRVTAVGAA